MNEITQRKVQQVCGTFYVSLPKFWAKMNGVSSKSRIVIHVLEDGSLRLSPLSKYGTDSKRNESRMELIVE